MSSSLTRRRFLFNAAAAAAWAPFVARGATSGGFEIGLVADAQYADADSSKTRFYRKSIGRLTEAVDCFNGRDLDFCVHLGDLIDHGWKNFDAISRPLALSRHTWHQLLGNHDFSVADAEKSQVVGRLGMKWRYGSFDHRGFRFVVLDTNDISTYAYPRGIPEHAEAERMFARVQAEQLAQARSYNGALGPTQLAWFDRACGEARAAGLKVIVLAHHQMVPASDYNLWNADEVLAIIDRHPHVVAWLNGHHHAGAFAERGGVPFVTMHGMVETERNAYATATIFPDRMVIMGHDREPSRELVFRS